MVANWFAVDSNSVARLEILHDLTMRIWNSNGHNADIMSIAPSNNEASAMDTLEFIVAVEHGSLSLDISRLRNLFREMIKIV